MKNSKNKIELLQIIRLVAASFIIIYHTGVFGERGYFGVEIFNILSGFLLIYTTEISKNNKKFILKRLIRIVPLYWILTFVAYAIICVRPSLSVMSQPNPADLIKSLFFIPFMNSSGYNVPVLAVGWTLNYEIVFYILFYIAMKINYKNRSLIVIFLTILFVLINNLLSGSYLFEYYSDIYLLEFLLGIVSYYLINLIKCDYDGIFSIFLKIFSVIICLYLMVDFGVEYGLHRFFRLGIPCMLLFINLYLLYGNKNFDDKFVKLGNMTFSVFLIEYFTTAIFRVFVANYNHAVQMLALIPLFLITFAISYISYNIIEIKFTKYLKEHLL